MDNSEELIEGKVNWRGRTAKKSKHGGLRASFFVLGTFGFENMATLVLGVTLVTYFSGVMNFNLADAANHVTNFAGTNYILTVVVAVLADTYVGRFKAVLISAIIEFVGLGLLAFQAHRSNLKPPPCIPDPNPNPNNPPPPCEVVSGRNAAILFVSLYLIALGSAGVKSAVPSHGADQFDEDDPKEAKQMSSFFNWLLLALCLGGAVSLTLTVWIIQDKGWDKGFGMSCLAMLCGLLMFGCGLPFYRIYVIQGSSAITRIAQVYVAAIRNMKLQLPRDSGELYEIKDKEAALKAEFLPHTNKYRFLDKAAIIRPSSQGENSQNPNNNNNNNSPWKLCTVTQVENAKTLLGMIPIFLCTVIMTLCLAQLQTFSIQQGTTMDTRITHSFKMPPSSIPIIPVCFLIIIIPVYDQIIVPFIRKFTGIPTGITHLQRVGVGLVLSCISMATASILEVKRKEVARENGMLDAIPILQPLPISVFWLSIQFFIFGIADMFTYVGLLEFFYSQAPKEIKSVSSCFLWTSMSLGYFLSSIMVKVVNALTRGEGWLGGNNLNRNHLDLFYALLSALSLANFLVYLVVASMYKYRAHTIINVGVEESELEELKN